jgi:hypothetical protein
LEDAPVQLPPQFLYFYGQQYRCMNCSGATSGEGVCPFVQPGPGQTLPVSHFGAITTAKIWLIPTNPKNDRSDSSVGFRPTGFVSRAALTDKQVQETFDHFSEYFRRPITHTFFGPWVQLLEGIELDGKRQSWNVKEDGSGGICAVDLVKCPTQKDWGPFVRKKPNQQDKKLIYWNCFEDVGPGQFLKRQISLHQAKVLIFADTAPYLTENRRINKDNQLFRLWPLEIADHRTGIWTFKSPPRLSIGLGAVAKIRSASPSLLKQVRDAIQLVIRAWECRIPAPSPLQRPYPAADGAPCCRV